MTLAALVEKVVLNKLETFFGAQKPALETSIKNRISFFNFLRNAENLKRICGSERPQIPAQILMPNLESAAWILRSAGKNIHLKSIISKNKINIIK